MDWGAPMKFWWVGFFIFYLHTASVIHVVIHNFVETGAAGLAEAERLEDFASSSEQTEESGEKEKEA